MAESVGAAAEVPHVGTDTNYRKARDLLRKISQEMYEMQGNEVDHSEQLERLQQKAIDITKVIELVEREFENVEEEDWQPRLTAVPASLDRKRVGQDDLRYIDDRREPTSQESRMTEAALGTPAMPAKAAANRPSEQSHQPPYQPPHAAPRALSPLSTVHAAQQQNSRPGVQPNEERRGASPPHAERYVSPPIPSSVEDDSYEIPSNISFNHGPNFSDCIASMELSNIVHDLEDAREDLAKAKEKLRKAKEHDDEEKVDRYTKRVARTDKEVRELDADHWRHEVEPLRRAYRFEVSQCLRQLDATIKYTEAFQGESHLDIKTQVEQRQLDKLDADALHDMDLLQKWLELCLRQPRTWRNGDQLLVGLSKGHPGSSLKDPQFVDDLLQEAAQVAPTSRPKSKSNDKQPKSAVEDSDSGRAPETVRVTPEILEGLLNGEVSEEVTESIQECPECKGEGGDLEHGRICSECEGTGSSKDKEDGFRDLCPKCSGRGFRLSKKYLCPGCHGFKIVLRVPNERKARTQDISPTAREVDIAPKRSSSTKRASFEPEALSDSGKSKKHRGYSPDEATRSPQSASTGPGRRRRHSQSRRPPDAAESLTAALSAVSAEVLKASKEPGSWAGEKGRRVLSAAIAAGSGSAANGGISDSALSDDDDDEKPRRNRRGSTRH